MNRAATIAVALVSGIVLITGCEDAAKTNLADKKESIVSKKEVSNALNQETANKSINGNNSNNELKENWKKYKGAWKLKVAGDEELYRLTALEDYFGRTAIDIENISENAVKGSICSIQGAPSYKQATVDFKGEIKNSKLTTTYKDENWLYSGRMELTFENEKIAANITRDKAKETPMWGILEGEFVFVRPIETKEVNMSDKDKSKLERFLAPVSKDIIKPFDKGELTDETIINFVGVNLGAGFLDAGEFGDKVKEKGAEIAFEKSVMNDLANRYFGVKIKKHKSHDVVKYENGSYIVPALGGVSKFPLVQMLMKDTENKGTYYAIADYMSENPEEGKKLEYECLLELQNKNNSSNDYTIQAIKEIKDPINFKALKQIQR